MLTRTAHVGHDSPMATTLSFLRRLAAPGVMACMVWMTTGPVMAAAPFEDTIAQRALACTACHGPQGRAAPDGYYPRLAGKPAGYLDRKSVV